MRTSVAADWLRFYTVVAAVCLVAATARATPDFSISIDSEGRTAPGVFPFLPECLGPGSTFTVSLNFANGDANPVSVQALVGADPGWHIEPGSCEASAGSCDILDPHNLQWTLAPLEPDDAAGFVFTLRVDSDVGIDTDFCFDLSVQSDSNTPNTAHLCPARRCGLGAPAADTFGLAVLAGVLLLSGIVILRRRTR